jgi:glutathione peroxidase|tara:strand:+ start:982 stop:1533 length:552 start_codon:yes stop_codon:yes gene_type:complete
MKNFKLGFYILIFMFSFLSKSISENSKTFFDFKINSIDGQELDLSIYKDKTLLVVNVASKCGFTKQYDELQNLYELYSEKGLIVLAVPSNQFGGQEPGSEAEIKNFCETNFNITFPIMSKYDVKGNNAHPIYSWAKETYGMSAVPKWNFHKILINKNGKIVDTFASFTSPTSRKIIKKIEQIL